MWFKLDIIFSCTLYLKGINFSLANSAIYPVILVNFFLSYRTGKAVSWSSNNCWSGRSDNVLSSLA